MRERGFFREIGEKFFRGAKKILTDDITLLLAEWSKGNEAARNELIPMVADELRRIARRYLAGERQDHTLQATALINEAYLRLIDQREVRWQNRAHFFGIAAQLMRRILVDHARTRQATKRAGNLRRLSLDDVVEVGAMRARELIALDDALTALALDEPERAQVVELRFFGGLTIEETAEALGISIDAVKAHWRLAKARLYQDMKK